MPNFEHISVLREELIESLNIQPGSCVVDCTAGAGGHTDLILQAVGCHGQVLAFDRDPWAIDTLEKRFPQQIQSGQLKIIRAPFSELAKVLQAHDLLGKVDAMCADIGVSSPQIDHGERGFSFTKDGPLDMRMDPDQGLSAADLINTYPDHELFRIFWDYGEEPKSKFIVRAIVLRRAVKPILTTFDLADLIAANVHYKERSRKHPATKVFQALRIAVNDELGELRALLKSLPIILSDGGRSSIISFHSLEDRLVKNEFRALSAGDAALFDKNLPLTTQQLAVLENKQFRIIKPFPITPSPHEQDSNPRSRSAKLRVIEKLKKG